MDEEKDLLSLLKTRQTWKRTVWEQSTFLSTTGHQKPKPKRTESQDRETKSEWNSLRVPNEMDIYSDNRENAKGLDGNTHTCKQMIDFTCIVIAINVPGPWYSVAKGSQAHVNVTANDALWVLVVKAGLGPIVDVHHPSSGLIRSPNGHIWPTERGKLHFWNRHKHKVKNT